MMKRKYLFPILAAGTVLTGCEESRPFGGDGTLCLSAQISSTVETVNSSRSTDADLSSSVMVWISNSRGLVRRYKGLSEIPSSITLKADSYIAEAWAGDSVPASFDARYFTGDEPFEITAGGTAKVLLNCRIANVVASVEYDADVDEVISGYSLTVGHSAGSVMFEGRDQRKAYFMMPSASERSLTYSLTAVKNDGSALSQTGTLDGVRRATEYRFKIGRNAGNGDEGAAFFTIDVDSTTVDEESEVVITLPPDIAGRGFDITAPVYGEKGKFEDVILEIASVGEIESLTVGAESAAEQLGAASVDMMTLDEDRKDDLKRRGLEHAYAYDAVADRASLRLTIGASLINGLPEGEHPFAVTATDSYGKSSSATVIVSSIKAPVVADVISVYDVWATRATLSGSVLEAGVGDDCGFKYRIKGSSEWTAVAATVKNASGFQTTVEGLEPATDYEIVAVSADFTSSIVRSFTTESAAGIPNGDFETWNTSSKTYLLAADSGSRFWDTGNHGSSTLNTNVTTPSADMKHGGRYSARLASQFVGVMGIGKFAAGNAFVGQYLATDGTDGVLGFGRPFTSRPSALKGYMRYEPKAVTHSSLSEVSTGSMDKGSIYVAILADGPQESYGGESYPFVIKTKASERRLFDRDDPRVIGFGELVVENATSGDGFEEFEIPITYKRTDAKAAHLVLVCSASYYGDFFTGGPSVMYIDDFTFEY